MRADVLAGIIHIAGDYLPQLVHPFIALRFVGADQGMHRQYIHIVIMRLGALGDNAVAQILIINNVIAAYQTGQIEGLAGRVYRHGVLACPVGDGLCRNVLVTLQNDVRPDLVRDDDAVVGLVDLHRLLQLPPFPDTAAGVVRAAEYGHMDFLGLQLGVHILIVHPPDAVFVLFQRAVDDLVAIVVDAHRKADVGGAVEQYAVTGGRKRGQRRDNAAQNTVLVADCFFGQTGHTVADRLPLYDRIVILVRCLKVAEGRVLGSLDDGFRDGGHGGKVHVRDPHGDDVKAVLGQVRGKAGAETVNSDGVLAVAIHDGCKIVLHSPSFFLVCAIPGPGSAPLTSINSIPRHPRTCKGIFRRTLL